MKQEMEFREVKFSCRISTGKMFAKIMVEFKVGIMVCDYIWKSEQLVIKQM